MAVAVTNTCYKVFGLNIMSSIPLPELFSTGVDRERVDVIVEEEDLSRLWLELASPPKKTVIKKNFFMFQLPELAIFCIQDGQRITVSPAPGADQEHIRLFILGSCMGAILLQRKLLPLHGSVLAINGKAYGIIGDSGAGKSTLASVFIKKGFQLLSDDIIAIAFSEDNVPLVMPAYPQQKLWQESLEELGMETVSYRPIFKRETKYAVPVQAKFMTEPLPLAALFELIKTDNEQIAIRPIHKLEQLQMIYKHTFRNFLLAGYDMLEWHFKTSANLAQQVNVYQVTRPSAGFSAPELADLLLSTITEEVKL